MATYKCDVKAQYGKFSGFAWKAGDAQGEAVAKDQANSAGAIEQVVATLKGAGFGQGDEVIFRDTAYGTLADLKGVMSRAKY